MLIYNTWGEEKKEKFREISVIVCDALSCSIKNGILRHTNTTEETALWKDVNESMKKYGFTINEIGEALEEFVYIG